MMYLPSEMFLLCIPNVIHYRKTHCTVGNVPSNHVQKQALISTEATKTALRGPLKCSHRYFDFVSVFYQRKTTLAPQ